MTKDQLETTDPPLDLESLVKTTYLLDSYSSAPYNPYRENYAAVMGALNLAAYKFYHDELGNLDSSKYIFQYRITWQYTPEELRAIAAGLTQNLTVYSTHILVNGRLYASNCVKLIIEVEE